MTLSHTNTQQNHYSLDNANAAMASFTTERREIFAIAKRMFNEGFKKSVILKMCSITEDEFLSMIRDLQQSRMATLS